MHSNSMQYNEDGDQVGEIKTYSDRYGNVYSGIGLRISL